MTKEPTEKLYGEYYKLDAHKVEKRAYNLFFDVLKQQNFDKTKATYVFDVDHTLLNVNHLKEVFNHAFATFDPVFSPSVWLDTYPQAKTKENYYDYTQHMAILAQKSEGNKEELMRLMERTVAQAIPEMIHPNLLWQMQDERDHINVVLATAGETLYHRLKIRALLAYLPVLPNAIIYIERTSKGDALNELYKYFKLPDEHETYLFDDNPSELEDVHQHCKGKKIHLIRVRQVNGHYNDKVLANLIRAEEWNYSNH